MANDRKESDRYRSDEDRNRHGGQGSGPERGYQDRNYQDRGHQDRGYETERPGVQDHERSPDRSRSGEYDPTRTPERYGQSGSPQSSGRGYGTDRPSQYGQNRGYESGRASQPYGQERYGVDRQGPDYGPLPSPGGYDRSRYGAGGMEYGDHERDASRYRAGRAYEPGHAPRGDSQRGYGQDRSWWDRATDEVSSWMGDDDAERRRRMDEVHDHSGRGPRGYTRSDDRIRDDVNDRLTEDWRVDASDIDVAVSGGEVTLTGSVQSRDQKRRAEDVAESVSGAKHVQNNLRVQQSSALTSGLSGTAGTTGMNATTAATAKPAGGRSGS